MTSRIKWRDALQMVLCSPPGYYWYPALWFGAFKGLIGSGCEGAMVWLSGFFKAVNKLGSGGLTGLFKMVGFFVGLFNVCLI